MLKAVTESNKSMKVLERKARGNIKVHKLKYEIGELKHDIKNIVSIIEHFYKNLYSYIKPQPPNMRLQNIGWIRGNPRYFSRRNKSCLSSNEK